MAREVYIRDSLTGGTPESLDGIDGSYLNDKDLAIVVSGGNSYFYVLDIDSGAPESSPDIISPDSDAGDKRWILYAAYGSGGGGGVSEEFVDKLTYFVGGI